MSFAPRCLPLSLFLLLSSASGFATAANAERVRVTPFAGWTHFDREYRELPGPELEDNAYVGGRLGVRVLGPLWIEGAAGVTPTSSRTSSDLKWSHVSGNVLLQPVSRMRVEPFVSLGLGASMYRPMISADERDLNLEAALGANVHLTGPLSLRLEARNFLLVPRERYGDAHFDNVVAGAGLTFAIGGGAHHDADGDGVPDNKDKCPNSPPGCLVDVNGCTVDTDGDGVCEGMDKCPGTRPGSKVDANGCPSDEDHDGVPDGIDQCPDTMEGCAVDASGCPKDADRDGVCDEKDQCPNTVPGCTVDARGCTNDADLDGVCDGRDKCPNTPQNVKVDSFGCPAPTPVQTREKELVETGMIRLEDVRFATASAKLLPASYPKLDEVGEVLSKYPQLRIEVGGHTDSRGSDAYNLDLSRRRAASVRAYLLRHFLKLRPVQLSSRGYGETKPVAPNTTPEGMAKNRRVEFKVLNPEELKRIPR